MKKIAFLLTFFFVHIGYSQNFGFTVGTPMQGQQIRAGFIIDSVMKMPIKDTAWPAVYTSVTPEACLVFRQSDKNMYFNDGTKWRLFSTPGSQINSDWNASSGAAEILNKPTIPVTTSQLTNNSGFITSNQNITLSGDVTGSGSTAITTMLSNTGVSAGKYDWVTVDTKGRVTSSGNMAVPISIASGGRNFNQAYQVSSTVQSSISVSASISCNLSLSGGQSGTVTLEISPNGTTGWIYIGEMNGSNTGTLTVGLNTTQISGAQLTADLPAGYYWRLTTTNVSGTPTYSFRGGSYITY